MMESITAPLAHSVANARTRLGIGNTLFWELVKRGDLRVIKLGHKTLVPETELQRVISERLSSQVAA